GLRDREALAAGEVRYPVEVGLGRAILRGELLAREKFALPHRRRSPVGLVWKSRCLGLAPHADAHGQDLSRVRRTHQTGARRRATLAAFDTSVTLRNLRHHRPSLPRPSAVTESWNSRRLSACPR